MPRRLDSTAQHAVHLLDSIVFLAWCGPLAERANSAHHAEHDVHRHLCLRDQPNDFQEALDDVSAQSKAGL